MPFPRPGATYSRPSWSLGRKIGAVLAFVVGGAVAGASGIMLFAPETPGAFALAPSRSADEPAISTTVAIAPAETAPAPSAADIKAMNVCLRGSGECEAEVTADPAAAVPGDPRPDSVQTAAAPIQGEATAPKSTTAAATPSKSAAETALQADFMVSRPIASVAPQLASAFTAATVPAVFLASRQIASIPHVLVSPALPALAARPKPVATTAVALPVPAEPPPAAEPPKPRSPCSDGRRPVAPRTIIIIAGSRTSSRSSSAERTPS